MFLKCVNFTGKNQRIVDYSLQLYPLLIILIHENFSLENIYWKIYARKCLPQNFYSTRKYLPENIYQDISARKYLPDNSAENYMLENVYHKKSFSKFFGYSFSHIDLRLERVNSSQKFSAKSMNPTSFLVTLLPRYRTFSSSGYNFCLFVYILPYNALKKG